MTDCDNAEVRDLLPDLAAESLAPAEMARVQAHVDRCTDCAEELALIRTARAVRPRAVAIDIAKIVAQLPKPMSTTMPRRSAFGPVRGVWRMAAAIGVLIVGGWSVLIVRSGGLGLIANGRADSLRLSDTPAGVTAPVVRAPVVRAPVITAPVITTTAGNAAETSVSFGSLSDYTDEELQRVFDRLDKWDGATSSEAPASTTPILPVRGGAR